MLDIDSGRLGSSTLDRLSVAGAPCRLRYLSKLLEGFKRTRLHFVPDKQMQFTATDV